ncbi:cytochrome P450 [Jatrophihabitans sp. GAS493]|uniref:cytochrome P450 n=1 Tax=Jatrophihabitans sp. GAS493 TaxID=1907575 RepID=UPI000BB6C8E3|nr:cytochrome P450 [Jatrophihabitans sp. GAS493]
MRLEARWFVLHGIVRFATKRWAKQGDTQARLIADPSTRIDPVPLFEQIRSDGPVSKTRVSNITVDHAITHAVLRSDDFRVISVGVNIPKPLRWVEARTRSGSLHPLQEPSLLAVEPPEHTRYRTLVSSVFTARAVNGLRDRVQQRADGLLDGLLADAAAGTEVDIVARYCAQLPVLVISEILGVPESERERVLKFGEYAAPSLDIGLTLQEFRLVDKGLREFDEWLGGHLENLRRNPGEDLMSQLTRASQDGERLNDRELRATAGLVLAAGFETTVNLLGSGVRLLLDNPEQLARLRADPALWSTAVDEVLRLESPVQLTARVARRDTVLSGVPMVAGEMIALVLAGANRDPNVFDDPHSFDVTRANASKHLSFSGGRHYCLGAALARVEGDVGLRSLFDRFPELTLAGAGTRRTTRVLRGWSSLPVLLGTPAQRPVNVGVSAGG